MPKTSTIKDWWGLAKTGFSIFVRSQVPHYPMVVSFDVTNRCTLKCRHCYWWEQERETELSEDAYFEGVKEIKDRQPTLLYGVWLGGEPLLRQKLVERCMKLFIYNEVITNGTIPLPNWKKVRFSCSVDGTKRYHELQRGKNIYEKIKKNIDRSDLNVNINCVVTKINESCLEEMVDEWSQTRIRSIGFSFYTPILGKNNDEIWLNFKERDKVIKRLYVLKKKYPKFINTSKIVLRNFESDRCQATTAHCRRDYAPFNGMCFDARLIRKFPCVIGEKADCSRCGCVAAAFGESLSLGDRSFIWESLRR